MTLAIETKDQTLLITRSGQVLTTYWFGADYVKPHFWPIIGPFGAAVTRYFPHMIDKAGPMGEPRDHPHHRGLHFTFGEVRAGDEAAWVDFWTEDAQRQGRIVHEGFPHGPVVAAGAVEFTASQRWLAPGGNAMLDDSTTWRVSDLGQGATLFTARIALRPAGGAVTFGDSKEGALAVRVATSMDELKEESGPRSIEPRGLITSSTGGVTEAQCFGKRGDWVDYAGTVDGRRVSLTMLDHPRNRPRACWFVRAYGLFAANPFGSRAYDLANPHQEVVLAPGEELVLRYGLLVHAGGREAIERAFNEFAS